jgi:hypothetical protein
MNSQYVSTPFNIDHYVIGFVLDAFKHLREVFLSPYKLNVEARMVKDD